MGNYRWEWATFNERLQVTELNLGSGVQDASLWKLKYEYGEINSNGDVDPSKNTGNIARLTTSFNGLSNPFVQTFKYDSLYRLTEAKEKSGANENWKELFSYDRYGNRLSYEKYLNSVQQSLDNKTHPSINPQTNRFNTNQGYTYDLNGNLISDAEGRNFTFNGDNKQSEIRNGTTLLAEYFYDGEGKRVKKKVYNPTGTVKEETVFVYDGIGKLIAEYSTAPPPPNPTTSYTATDMLGSPRVITDSQGNVTSRRDFMPFGEELANDPNYRTAALKYNTGDGVRQKFTGYQKDEETNLDFAEARMYENRHARFTAVDPLLASGKSANPQTFNRYVYVLNNPLLLSDPEGLQAGVWRGDVYVNADFTKFANYKKDGYTQYKGGPRRISAVDGYDYRITSNGSRCLGKTNPDAVDVAVQGVKDTIVGVGGTLYNGIAGINNLGGAALNRLSWEYIFTGTPRDAFEPAPYLEMVTPGEKSAGFATTFLMFYYGAAGAAPSRAPMFEGFSTETGTSTAISTLDLFGGETSQISGALNVDKIATSGVRASTEALPFEAGTFTDVVASGPRAPFLSEASRVMQPGGRLFINATKGNGFARLPDAQTLQNLRFRVIQENGPLSPRFSNNIFRRSDGTEIPSDSVRTTILERF